MQCMVIYVIHLHKTDIETLENNFVAEYVLNKRSVHVFVTLLRNLCDTL